MITIIDNLKLLVEDKKNPIDVNKILNNTTKKIIKKKIDSIKTFDLKHKVTITINGDINSFSFNINSDDSETIKSIREQLNK
jgi:hypothetical protein